MFSKGGKRPQNRSIVEIAVQNNIFKDRNHSKCFRDGTTFPSVVVEYQPLFIRIRKKQY